MPFDPSIADDPEDPDHSPADRARAAARSTWVSVAVNLVLSAVQIAVGILAKSQALVADGIHTLSDLIADFVVLFANHHSQKDADDAHPYGHQRFETAASLVLGVLLLAVGVGMLWAALGKLESPETIPTVHIVALWVAAGALVAKEGLFRYMLTVAKRVKSSMLVANAWHARSDAASSLVVGVGIVGNLAGYPILDPIAALIVGLLVLKMGAKFAWDALHDLVDRAVIRAAPTPPLRPVNPAKIAIFIRPFVPNTDAIVLQIPNVCLPAKKPEQLVDNRFEVDLFGRHQWKIFPQVEACLGAEQADRACPRAVRARTPLLQNQFEQAMVLEHG
jgi:cation diffusion facilitator family transporter